MNDFNIKCDCCVNRMQYIGMHLQYRHFCCQICGHERFLSEQVSVSSEQYEDDADYTADLAIAGSHKDLLMWNHIQAIKQLDLLLNGKGSRVLDIGCFNGFFVKELIERGFDAIGIDFNRKALEFGRSTYNSGELITSRTLADLERDGERFDAITMFEVIEHLEDFESVIQNAVRLLKDNGVIIISTPNSKMSWRPALDYPPHHLSRFTSLSIQRLMERTGLKVAFQREQMNLFDLVRNYVGSLFRRKSSQSMRGGQFRSRQAANKLRTIANRSKWLFYKISFPVDVLLHLIGMRYISQLTVAKKQ